MITHTLRQGSPEWLAYRATHFNASDAAAMLGISPHKTRTQLMHELHTGLARDVGSYVEERIFGPGHASEAKARLLAEEIIGEELYPVVGSEGRLSASFDGMTMSESIVWEHKLLNKALAESLGNGIIPDSYHPQLEQQLMISGAEKALFMVSDWQGDDLVAEHHVWYTSCPELRTSIVQGWTQFAIDLETYVPEVIETAPIGRTPETLPALHIEVTGMVTASNLAEYKAHALSVFSGINRELVTDAQFADAKKTVKWCGDIETRLAAAKQHALSQTASIDQLFKTIDDISAEARRTRLELDKLVSIRKDTIRAQAVLDGRKALQDHIAALNTRIGRPLMPAISYDFAGAIKNKSSIESMRNAIDTELARAKISANEVADKITLNLRMINAHPDYAFLFSDVAQLALKEPEFVEMATKNRIADHQAKEAARIEAERFRIAAEEQAKAQAVQFEELEKSEIKRLSTLNSSLIVEAAKTTNLETIALDVLGPPTLKLGQIAERLGFNLTADFLKSLGFEPAAIDKNARLYHEEDFPDICLQLVRHIQSVAQGVAA